MSVDSSNTGNFPPAVSPDLLEAIRAFPTKRVVSHCRTEFEVSPFDIYASCPQCGGAVKVRSFSGGAELEDVFDAVFRWLLSPEAAPHLQRRQLQLGDDDGTV